MRSCERWPAEVPGKSVLPAGFTLIELLVTISVAAVLLVIAVPSFTSLINSNRLTSATNEMVAAIQTARMEAVRNRHRTVVCSSADGEKCGAGGSILVFSDINNNGQAEDSELLRMGVVSPHVEMGQMAVVFRPDGFGRKSDGSLESGVYRLCIPTSTPAENVREVHLVAGSRISTRRSDGDGACR